MICFHTLDSSTPASGFTLFALFFRHLQNLCLVSAFSPFPCSIFPPTEQQDSFNHEPLSRIGACVSARSLTLCPGDAPHCSRVAVYSISDVGNRINDNSRRLRPICSFYCWLFYLRAVCSSCLFSGFFCPNYI